MSKNWRDKEHARTITGRDKNITVVDDHQYAILVWAELAARLIKPPVLVSIDYHPDTDPPFWLWATQKAIAKDPEREESLKKQFQDQKLAAIDPLALESLEVQMPFMNNDEQINTAMALGFLSDYHMINCMAKHHYATGHHYLVPRASFGDLSDEMFVQAGFSLSLLPQNGPVFLDIDLDYFPDPASFQTAGPVFRSLVNQAAGITIARSDKYFDYLKQTKKFTLGDCETACIQLIHECSV